MQARAPKAEPLPPSLDPRLLEELHDGLVCLSGCARDGLAVRDPNAAARLARVFGRDRFFVELQRPYERGDVRRNAQLRDLAETLKVRTVATGDVHAHTQLAPRCRTCSSRSAAAPRSTAASASGAATTSPFSPRPPTCSSVSPTTATPLLARVSSPSGSTST